MDPLSGALSNSAAPVSTAMLTAQPAWYVVETKRHRERVAQRFLQEKGVPSYAPRIAQWPPPAVGSEIALMFPGYLFVRSSLPDQFDPVRWTPGVKAFVSFGDTPPALDDTVVEFLQRCEGPDGVIRCGADTDTGAEVRIIRGPFRGLTAMIERPLPAGDRIRVLMHILQRATRVELPVRWVTKA